MRHKQHTNIINWANELGVAARDVLPPLPTSLQPKPSFQSNNATIAHRRSFTGLSESTLRVLVRFRLSHFCFIFVCLPS